MTNRFPDKQIQNAYSLDQERYAAFGVDTDKALKTLAQIPISLHCWQGDDVGGFESPEAELGGVIAFLRLGLELDDGAGPGGDRGHRFRPPVLAEYLGHT